MFCQGNHSAAVTQSASTVIMNGLGRKEMIDDIQGH